jgi:hypothetical protein
MPIEILHPASIMKAFPKLASETEVEEIKAIQLLNYDNHQRYESASTSQFDLISHATRSIHTVANRHSVRLDSFAGVDSASIDPSLNNSVSHPPPAENRIISGLQLLGEPESDEGLITRPTVQAPEEIIRVPTPTSPNRTVYKNPSIGYGSAQASSAQTLYQDNQKKPALVHSRVQSNATYGGKSNIVDNLEKGADESNEGLFVS